MASEGQKAELKDKTSALVDAKFGGDWDHAFRHYSAISGAGSLVDREDLLKLLEDAGIGSWLTRGAWADGIIKEMDSSSDGRISRDEFRDALKRIGS